MSKHKLCRIGSRWSSFDFFFHNFVFHNSFWNQTFRWLSISKIFSIMGTKKSWLSQTSLPSTKCWPSRSILSMGMFTTIQSTHSGLNFTKILRAAFSCKNCFAQLLCAYSLGVYFLWKKNSEKAACKMSVILTTGRNQGFSALLPNRIKGQESWAKLEACTQWDSSMAKSTNFWRIFSFRLLIW